MKKLSLSDIASLAFAASGVGDKNTVSNGPDNGANNCQATHWWQVMRHGTTQQAMTNVLTAAFAAFDPPAPEFLVAPGITGTGAANFIGHANEGLLETGMGQTGPFDQQKIIYLYNESVWGPQFDRIQPTPIIYVALWGCNPGAGEDGAELVYRVAKRCQRAVRAPTGTLFCNRDRIWLENGSQWQVGTPSHKPAPIPKPSQHALMAAWKFEVGGKIIGADAVRTVRIVPASQVGVAGVPINIEGKAASEIVESIFRSPPIDLTDTRIPAFITANIVLGLEDGEEVAFKVYNDGIAVNEETETGYFIGSLTQLNLV